MRIGCGVVLNEMGGVEIMFILGNGRFGNHHFVHKPFGNIVHRLQTKSLQCHLLIDL